MSEGRTAAGTARRGGSGPTRVARAWQALPHESRLAAFASGALFLTLFLPWYQVTLIAPARSAKLESASATITGWGAFSFVEAAVLLVAAGVLVLLFYRAEGHAFHLPGGDGGVITAAGVWTGVLIVWRIFDKQGATTNGPSATSSGVEWGIFIALAAAAFLAYSGSRIRAAHRPEPPLPGDEQAPAGSSAAATVVRSPRPEDATPRRRRSEAAPSETPRSEAARSEAPRSEPPPRRRSEQSSRHRSEQSSRRRSEPPPRWPAGNPPPVAADPEPPTEVTPEVARNVTPEVTSEVTPNLPRRRATAAELFERVVPDDPPTMPFGRAKPADVEPTIRRARPLAEDEQLTMPLDEDETAVLGRDETVVLGEDETLPLGDDATQTLGEDPTLPLEHRPKRH